MRFLKKLLVSIYAFLGMFTVATLIVYAATGTEPTTLIGCVFGVTGVESLLSVIIKFTETKTEVIKNGTDT